MFHIHKWKVAAVDYFKNIPYKVINMGIEDKIRLDTSVLYVCEICGKHKIEKLDGEWTIEALKK